nr:anaerobic ribonucleoside-triphosphate reductase activating protein [uncultured Catonella sp.]
MNYSEIKYFDVANGPGIRTSFFVSGCTHHCKGCFNEIAQDFNAGLEYTTEVEGEIISSLYPSFIAGLTILGGEPMEVRNQEGIVGLVKKIKKEISDKTIWLFSGYTFEELFDKKNKRCYGKHTMDILKNIDVLVDGKFILELKDLSLKFRGSSNQRIIDMKRSLAENRVVLSEYMYII